MVAKGFSQRATINRSQKLQGTNLLLEIAHFWPVWSLLGKAATFQIGGSSLESECQQLGAKILDTTVHNSKIKILSHTVVRLRRTIGKPINVISIPISTQHLNGTCVAIFLVSMAMRSKTHEKQRAAESYIIFHITSPSQ